MIDDSLDVYQSNAVVYQGNDSTEVTLVVTSDPERFRDFVSLHPRKQPQEELRLKDSGVVITGENGERHESAYRRHDRAGK